MLGFIARLGSGRRPDELATGALRRIQLFFWVATVVIVALFALGLSWVSYDNLARFTSQALAAERQIACNIARYHIESYLAANGYSELLPGKVDVGLNRVLDDLVRQIPFIDDIRVVNRQRYHVATGGNLAPGLLDDDLRDRCVSAFEVTGSDESGIPVGRFHDPGRMQVYCWEANLVIEGEVLGRVAIHESNPGLSEAYERALGSSRLLIFSASALLLGALSLTIVWSGREMRRLDQRIAQGERSASLAQLAAGVAHEIRNPLNTIALTCTYLGRKLDDGGEPVGAQESLDLISSEARRLQDTISDFLRFARTPSLDLGEVDLGTITDSTLDVLGAELRAAGIEVDRRGDAHCQIAGDDRRLREVVMNLVRNSIQAIRERDRGHGRIEVTLTCGRRRVALEVADDGAGIAEDVRERVFEPYFTTKEEGLGLGLAQVEQDIRAHGGNIHVGAGLDGGARFTISLPISS
jgi:signal transduction histidine kinase